MDRNRATRSPVVTWFRVVTMGLAIVVSVATGLQNAALAQYDSDCCDSAESEGGCDVTLSCDQCLPESRCPFCTEYSRIAKTFAASGITLQSNLTQFYMGNTTGGLEREFRYAGRGDYLMNVDFGKLGVQEGLFLKVRAEHRFGESLAGTTGAVLPPNVAADLPVSDHNDLYVTNFLFTQALSESFVVFAGKLDTLDGDVNAFAHGRGVRQFSNMAFVANPLALRTVPYSTLGMGFSYLFEGEPLLTLMVLNTTDTTRTTGLGQLFAQGAAVTGELRLPTNFRGQAGHQLFGATWSSREFVSLGQDPRIILPNVPIVRKGDSWSLYWNMDQYLVSDRCNPGRGWGYFARAGIADQNTNPLSYFLSAGLGGSSPIADRENDSFGVGYYYAGTSDEIGPILTIALGSNIGEGQGVELFYNAVVTPMLTITPDFQVISPARENIDTAVVAGMRMNIAF